MAGIVFPSIANALVPLMQLDQQREDRTFQRERATRQDALHAEESKYRRESMDEQRALRIQSHLATMDEKKRAMVKDFAEFRVKAGGAVLAAPPEQRAQAYAMYVQAAKERGYDMSLFPQQWDPSTERRLQFDVDQSIPWADRPQAMPAPGGSAPAPGGSPDLTRAGNAISGIESVGQPNGGYGAIGPQTKMGRAYGKYQVMDFNVGPWTAEVLGQPMTPQEFLTNPQAQDAVFKAKFGQLAQKHGPEGAARAWFAGEGGMNNPNASDVNGMTVARYADKFNKGYGGQPTMGTPPASMVAQGANAAPMPNVSPQQAGALPGNPAQMPGGFTPTNMPAQSVPGGLPQVAQGDAVAGQGDVMAPPRAAVPEADVLRQIQLPPDAAIALRKGKPTIQDGRVEIIYRDGRLGYANLPPKKEQSGPFAGTGLDAQMHNIVLEGMRTGKTDTPEYAAALAHIGAERVIPDPNSPGGFHRIKPDISWAAPSRYAGGQVPQPAAPPVPGTKTVTTEPGKGRPLDNSARDDLTKASGGVLELTELVKSFDPSFGGYTLDKLGDASNFAKRNLPDALGGADPKGQAQWWQRYDMFANLERNKLFGSALTPGETAAFKAAMVSPGMKPEQIKANLSRQQEIASKALSRIANSMKAGGYNQEAIEAATGIRLGDMPDPIGSVPQGPPPGGPADKAKQQFDLKKKWNLE